GRGAGAGCRTDDDRIAADRLAGPRLPGRRVAARTRLAARLLPGVRGLAAPGRAPRPGTDARAALRPVRDGLGFPSAALSVLRQRGSPLARLFPSGRGGGAQPGPDV